MSTSTRVGAPALIGRRLAPPPARPGHAPPASDSRRTYALFGNRLRHVTVLPARPYGRGLGTRSVCAGMRYLGIGVISLGIR